MNVFIAHAEADQAAADNLKTFLKSRGLVVETETGERGFRHLQASDVVIALWSQKSLFATQRMQLERRMLDAWAEQQLVLVKLDHAFLPVGLRDLPAIDASFEQSRELAVWPQVERKARELANAALVQQQAQADSFASQTRAGGGPGAGFASQPAPSPQARTAPMAKKSGGSAWLGLALCGLFLAGLAVVGIMLLPRTNARPPSATTGAPPPVSPFSLDESSQQVWLIGGVVVVVGLALLTLVLLMGRRGARRATGASAAAAAAPPPPAAEAPAAVFISYSHADDASVTQLVAIVEKTGRAVWIDKTGIHSGDGWAGEIVRAIKAAHGVIVMCSKHSFESDHVKREVYLADKYKKPMAPVFLEQAQPPEDFEFFFANVQWLELWKLPEADRAAAIGAALKAV